MLVPVNTLVRYSIVEATLIPKLCNIWIDEHCSSANGQLNVLVSVLEIDIHITAVKAHLTEDTEVLRKSILCAYNQYELFRAMFIIGTAIGVASASGQ